MRYFLTLLILCTGSICMNSAYAETAPAASDTLTVQPSHVPDWFVMDARVEPIDQGTVSAQTSGRVSAISVDVNDVVPSGHLLVEITNTSQTAGQDQAKAAVKPSTPASHYSVVMPSKICAWWLLFQHVTSPS